MELCKLHRMEKGSDDFISDCGRELYFPDCDPDFKPNKEFNFCCYCGKPMNRAALKLMESATTSIQQPQPEIALLKDAAALIERGGSLDLQVAINYIEVAIAQLRAVR
jgi:hypothetical protein